MIRLLLPACFLATALLAAPLHAHVAVDQPNGGEVIRGQSVYSILWHDTINHGSGVTYEVELSIDGGLTWTQIAVGLPYTGGTSSYDWSVPDLDTTQGRIRVTMHVSASITYADVSDGDFSIVASYWTYGSGTPVNGVEPLLEGRRVPVAGQAITLHLSQAEVGAAAHFLAGTGRINVSKAGVTILTRPSLAHLVRTVDNNGEVTFQATLPAGLLGRTVDLQAVVASHPTNSASAGLEFLVLP